MLLRESFGLTAEPIIWVAIATGNVVANLPPLFALLEDGDALLWMTSEEADRRRGMLFRSKAAVSARFPTLKQMQILQLPEFPQFWRGDKEGELRLKIEGFSPVLIGNGGTKPMQTGVRSALRRIKHSDPAMVYGELRPPGFAVQADGGEGEAKRYVYPSDVTRPGYRRTIGLREVLEANGYEPVWHRGSLEASCIWPGPTLEQDGYGIDPDETFTVHAEDFARHQDNSRPDVTYPNFNDARFGKESLRRLRNSLRNLASKATQGNDDAMAIIYNTFRRQGLTAARCRTRTSTTVPKVKMGELFHRAVERRVVSFLNDKNNADYASKVSEVWTDFDIYPVDDTGRRLEDSTANFDVFILLVNGVALHLECKFALRAEPKEISFRQDLTARVLRLQRATSSVARMIVCVPLYTGAANATWCQETAHDIKARLQGMFEFIQFTLPEQPAQFPDLSDQGIKGHEVLSFEESLRKLL